ncbi:MAG: energy-coupling factor transporter transmembrane protein EcfT [Atopobium sp.]|nr:energy-coupling factor transporter transmembrane protein EcfT [Atopobium sp.]
MALKISVGQYYHGDSLIHRLNPNVKCLAALLLMLVTFFIRNAPQLALLVVGVLCLLALAKIPVKQVLVSIIPLAWLLIFLSLFNLLLTREGTVLVSWSIFTITDVGAWSAFLYPVRILAAILMGALLLLTTTQTDLGNAFEAACSPLSKIGLPGKEIAMIFSLMLRFIPTLADDAVSISEAQTARAGDVASGSLPKRLRATFSIVVALLASSLRHANNLSKALDARHYVAGASRTRWHQPTFGAREAIALVVTVCFIALIFVLA